MTGQRKFTGDNVFERRVLSGVQAAGGKVLDPEIPKGLQQLQNFSPVFDKIDKFVDKYLVDQNSGGGLGKVLAPLKGAISKSPLISTDAKNELDQIKTQALNVGKGIEGMTGGRVTVQQLSLVLDGIASLSKTKQQGHELVQN